MEGLPEHLRNQHLQFIRDAPFGESTSSGRDSKRSRQGFRSTIRTDEKSPTKSFMQDSGVNTLKSTKGFDNYAVGTKGSAAIRVKTYGNEDYNSKTERSLEAEERRGGSQKKTVPVRVSVL